jgi:hypothetical protein
MDYIKKTKAILCIIFIILFAFNGFAKSRVSVKNGDKEPDYLEIPREYLDKPILLINKITGYPNKLYHYGSSGMQVDYSVMLRFKLHNNSIKVIQEQYQNSISDTDIIKTSVNKNHFDPTICYIPIVSLTKKSVKIDVDFFKNNIELFSPVSRRVIKKYVLKPLEKEPVIINNYQLSKNSFLVSRTLNYIGEKSPRGHYSKYVSVEQLLTFRVLPENPIKPRKWDPRVGNFYLWNKKYSSESQFIKRERFLERWRLEPEDTAAYFRGELTRPKEPIVFYMDENVPHKWRKYIKQGVLDWLPVFESIGFKDAIEVHDKPKNAKWDDNDPNYNMIRWVSSEIKDAQGNYISDPRTGEILNGMLIWYQNYFLSVNSEYFVAAAAVDTSARRPVLPDELFGKLMRETMAHEMGHSLGLGHNMIASSLYPTDSLRSNKFVAKYSIAPSIMDYANFNFIAQPEDMPLPLMRKIGPYDYWAIEHAYKYVRPSADNSGMEIGFTNREMNKKLQNRYLYYMEQEYPEVIDPTNMTGDLGDDPILSGEYALKNLKRIMPHIVEWSLPEDGDPTILLDRHDKLIAHLNTIFKGVIILIGGEKNRFDNSEFILKTTYPQRSEEAIDFLSKHLFTDMEWLYNKELERISDKASHKNSLCKVQSRAIRGLLNKNRLKRLIDYDLKNGEINTLTILRKLSDVVIKNSSVDNVPIAIQELYVKRMKELIQNTKSETILNHLLKEELDYVRKTVRVKAEREKNVLIKAFYDDLIE